MGECGLSGCDGVLQVIGLWRIVVLLFIGWLLIDMGALALPGLFLRGLRRIALSIWFYKWAEVDFNPLRALWRLAKSIWFYENAEFNLRYAVGAGLFIYFWIWFVLGGGMVKILMAMGL